MRPISIFPSLKYLSAEIIFFILHYKFRVSVVLDTNLWYHATQVLSDEVSVTVGAEYD